MHLIILFLPCLELLLIDSFLMNSCCSATGLLFDASHSFTFTFHLISFKFTSHAFFLFFKDYFFLAFTYFRTNFWKFRLYFYFIRDAMYGLPLNTLYVKNSTLYKNTIFIVKYWKFTSNNSVTKLNLLLRVYSNNDNASSFAWCTSFYTTSHAIPTPQGAWLGKS